MVDEHAGDRADPTALEYGRPRRRKRKRPPYKLIAILLALALLIAVLLPDSVYRGESIRRSSCASHLRLIGQALLFHGYNHGGKYPDTIEGLLEDDIGPDVFVCPDTTDTKATGATTQAVAADMAKPGHLSYVYLGKGFTNKCSPDTVLVYEPLANHSNAGSNVLFGDGRVSFIPAASMKKILAELAAGQNPPPSAKGL
ncbi:MAG TPA: hypothetical protein VIL86_20900 [Tepidisphaeraceae bacterium]|jgi:prepilin-type processing-associated H-X9-DG protein